MKKNKNIPELRFPEFISAKEWEETPLEELGSTFNGLSGKSGSDFGKGSPFVTYMQVFKSNRINTAECGFVSIEKGEKQNSISKGDILITTSSETPEEVGFASVLLEQPEIAVYLNSFCFGFRPNDPLKLDPTFSSFLFRSTSYRKAISVLGQGSTRFNISKSAFLKLRLSLPLISEQQKIADCLSSLDDLLKAETEKLEALRAHKKGLMQQLFPAEGARTPAFRFPEFRGTRDWEQVTLESISKFHSGGTPSKDDSRYWGGSVPWISASSMHDYEISKSESFITDKAVADGAAIASKGSLLLLVRGSMLFKRIPMGIATRDVAFNQDVKALEIDAQLSNYFLLYHLIALESKLLSLVSATGIGAGKLDTNTIKELMILVPSIAEQKKIADCLCYADILIKEQSAKLEQLRIHKRALSQGLFPS